MKLAAQKLNSHLGRNLAPVYLVAGDEPLVVAEALEAIRARARHQGFEQRDLYTVERGFRWSELVADADSLSLFARRRILEVRLASLRPGDEGRQTIQELVEREDQDRLLIIVTPKLDSAAGRAAWVKAIDKHGVIVQAWPVERAYLPAWIRDRAARSGLRFTASAAELLADRTEGNLLAADQEIQKLALLHGQHEVTESDVLDSVADSSRYDVFRLVDAVLAGNARRALSIVDGLRGEGVEPALVLWALSRELGLLIRLKTAIGQGKSESSALSKLRVWPRRQPLLARAIRRNSLDALRSRLVEAAEVDAIVKGLRAGSPWDALTRLVMEMLATESPGRAA
ncbi:MAG TPA: DNA polymerase III subunit delta [Gammaproteobacteria bacterium]